MVSFRTDNGWAALFLLGDNYFKALGEAVCFLRVGANLPCENPVAACNENRKISKNKHWPPPQASPLLPHSPLPFLCSLPDPYPLNSFSSPPVFLSLPLCRSVLLSYHFCLPVSLHLSLCLCSPWLCLLVSPPQSQVAMSREGSCPPGPWSRPVQTCPAHPDLLGLICHPL